MIAVRLFANQSQIALFLASHRQTWAYVSSDPFFVTPAEPARPIRLESFRASWEPSKHQRPIPSPTRTDRKQNRIDFPL